MDYMIEQKICSCLSKGKINTSTFIAHLFKQSNLLSKVSSYIRNRGIIQKEYYGIYEQIIFSFPLLSADAKTSLLLGLNYALIRLL